MAGRPVRTEAVLGADEGSGNESSSELEWRQEWDADSRWRPWAVHPDPIGVPCQPPSRPDPHHGLVSARTLAVTLCTRKAGALLTDFV